MDTDTGTAEEAETRRVWLVERTYSDDELNIVILTYATPDGEWYHRKERALTSFTGDQRETLAALEVPVSNLGRVEDDEEREWFATEASRMRAEHEPDDAV